ncbi:unnamed protein product [Caretta caretta]
MDCWLVCRLHWRESTSEMLSWKKSETTFQMDSFQKAAESRDSPAGMASPSPASSGPKAARLDTPSPALVHVCPYVPVDLPIPGAVRRVGRSGDCLADRREAAGNNKPTPHPWKLITENEMQNVAPDLSCPKVQGVFGEPEFRMGQFLRLESAAKLGSRSRLHGSGIFRTEAITSVLFQIMLQHKLQRLEPGLIFLNHEWILNRTP